MQQVTYATYICVCVWLLMCTLLQANSCHFDAATRKTSPTRVYKRWHTRPYAQLNTRTYTYNIIHATWLWGRRSWSSKVIQAFAAPKQVFSAIHSPTWCHAASLCPFSCLPHQHMCMYVCTYIYVYVCMCMFLHTCRSPHPCGSSIFLPTLTRAACDRRASCVRATFDFWASLWHH